MISYVIWWVFVKWNLVELIYVLFYLVYMVLFDLINFLRGCFGMLVLKMGVFFWFFGGVIV